MPRYRVTIEFSSDGRNAEEAKQKAEKLCTWLNNKSPLYNAWIPKMVVSNNKKIGENDG